MTTIDELRSRAEVLTPDFAPMANLLCKAADELEALQRINDQNAHDFKQLRDALKCDGSDLPQLLSAVEVLQKDNDKERETVGCAICLTKERDSIRAKISKLQAIINHLHENRRLKIEAYQELNSLRAQLAESRAKQNQMAIDMIPTTVDEVRWEKLKQENASLRAQNQTLREACVQFVAWYHVDPFKDGDPFNGSKHWQELPAIVTQAEQALAQSQKGSHDHD